MSENPSHGSETTAKRWDRVLRALSKRPRRKLILRLLDEQPNAWVRLPDAAMSEHGPVVLDELEVELRHKHLPALADDEFVLWRDSPFEAARGPRFDEVGAVMEAIVSGAGVLPEELVAGCESLETGQTG